jgi:transposase, IS605 orfB family|nr:MAG TPA: endonuclease [Caudoviricetes sp.]
MVKSVKIRIYPNATQLKAITDILDACRFVKNKYLEYNVGRHDNGEDFITGNEFVKVINKLKKEDKDYLWLDTIYSKAIKYAIKEEDSYLNAYYAKRKCFPGFIAKNRVDNESYYFIKDSIQYISKNVIQLPVLGNTRITSGDKLLPDRDSIKSGRIVRNYNKYYVVFIYDTENDRKNMVKNDITLGIAIATNNNDYIVVYDGNECRHYKSYKGLDTYKHTREIMGKLEQVVSIKSDYNFNRLFNNYMNEHGTSPNEEEKEKMREESYNTSNIRRVQLEVNKCRVKLDNIVDDFIKKLVNELTVKIKPYQINLEDLDMIDIPDDETQRLVQMLMEETNFHKFKNRLINKCKEYGIKLWAVSSDRFGEYEDLLEKK